MASQTAIDLCSLAWGDREGYVSVSTRAPSKPKEDPDYWSDHLFRWPKERDKVEALLDKAKGATRDVYWAPAVFNKPARDSDAMLPTNMLWSDLDEVEPDTIPKHLKPTAVWESSPGRYQALWKLTNDLAPKLQQQLNQRLTYALGADRGGWDRTQVLRTPGTHNHKYDPSPEVKLIYLNGRSVDALQLMQDLPEVKDVVRESEVRPELEHLDPQKLLRAVRSRLSGRARQLLRAKRSSANVGIRSERLWELECLLAEGGLKTDEIVSLVRGSAWNKFAGRGDELSRLQTEANKARAHVGADEDVGEEAGGIPDDDDEGAVGGSAPLEDDAEEIAGPLTWNEFDADHSAISWIIADVWGEGEVGFISGPPKAYKSWVAVDAAVSLATGTRFLGSFQCKRIPTLLIQEEDPRVILQDRLAKVAAAKGNIWSKIHPGGIVEMQYDLPDDLYVISNQGFSITEDWLDLLEEWITERGIKAVILDPLMMMGEGVTDEFKAFEMMNNILKPLKKLRSRTGAALMVVHHHVKNSQSSGASAMYGSVALWAWEEAALHLHVQNQGRVVAERFSKHSLLKPLTIELGDTNAEWKPTVYEGLGGGDNLIDILASAESPSGIEELESITGVGKAALLRQLKELKEQGKVESTKDPAPGPGRKRTLWRATR